MKVVTTVKILQMLKHARDAGLNRQLHPHWVERLDWNGNHVLSKPMIHNDSAHIRCTCCMLKIREREAPLEAILDFTWEDWNSIPEHKEV